MSQEIIEYPVAELRIPNREYWKSQIKCQSACPVHTDARGYIRAIAVGDYELAYLIARGPNPLASICGRICGAPCEISCRRGDLDKPIAIRTLKRFVCDKFGPEVRPKGSQELIDFLKQAAQTHTNRPCEDAEELLPLLQSLLSEDIPLVEGKSVGIIGSGPAGLAAAHDLALLGFKVTIYEMESVLAGMLAVGVPPYRLPRDLIQAEVDVILNLGVEAVTNIEVGNDISFPEVRAKHDSVVIAVGAKRSRRLAIPGSDAKGVIGGVEYLRDVFVGNPPTLGQRVIVIGGGNVAYDVGRTALRQISLDAARMALRAQQVSSVHLCSLESLEELPADDMEIMEGDEEGIIRMHSLGPAEILKDDQGNLTGVVFRKCLRVFDENQRFAPLFDDTIRETIPCDTVLLSIGQEVDIRFVDAARDGLEVSERGYIVCDADTGRTNKPDIFISGDLAYGPKLLIHAVASGKQVARAIYESVTGRPITYREVEFHLALPDYQRECGYETQKRVAIPTTDAKERIQAQDHPVETNYSQEQACREASRCLDCGINTIFDGSKCILCGGCVDVCPELCLRIVSVDRLNPVEANKQIIHQHLAGTKAEQASVILKDETVCIRCGLCAQRCPTGAITMERFIFQEVPACQTA